MATCEGSNYEQHEDFNPLSRVISVSGSWKWGCVGRAGCVATMVTKLFNIVEPGVAVFGKKDYQQWHLIQRMVTFFLFSDLFCLAFIS